MVSSLESPVGVMPLWTPYPTIDYVMTVFCRVLVVKDAPSVNKRVVKWLKEQQYVCVFVENDDEARARLNRESFDAVMYTHEFLFPPWYIPPKRVPG